MTAQAADELESRVIAVVAEALSMDPSEVNPYSSLIDDLGAESIDFIDIVFRLESEFDMLIPEGDLWKGSLNLSGDDPQSIAAAIEPLRARWPAFAWDRFANGIQKSDLPRLITITTIVDYLRKNAKKA